MKKTVHKLFWAWEFDREEKWLNDMSAKGLQLTDVGFCRYVFETGTPGEYQYRLQLLNHAPDHPESEHYIAFTEEMGAEQVGSLMRWVYFRKKAADGEFQLFSDMDSRIRHLQRILELMLICMALEFWVGFSNLFVGNSLHSSFNLGVAIPTLLLGAFIAGGVISVSRKIFRLKAEREIHE